MQSMDGHNTPTDEMLQTLLVRTAVMQAQMQAQNDATLLESVRAELHKSLATQTLRLFIWITGACSGIAAAAYYIGRNVY